MNVIPTVFTLPPSDLTGSLAFLSQFPNIGLPAVLISVLIVVILILAFLLSRASNSSRMPDIPMTQVLSTLTTSTRPLFLSTESSLFNMLRFAVQDRYLIFAKLPLLTVITIEEQDPNTRKMIMRAIQHVRIDIAMIHPGTLQLEKIIRFMTPETSATQPSDKERLVTAIIQSAEIDTYTLDTSMTYTIPELLTVLHLADED